MKNRFALLTIALLLTLALVPAHYQSVVDPPGQNCSSRDAFSQFPAIANPFFHPDHGLRWMSVPFSPAVFFMLPKALPSSTESRAPPV